MFFFFVFLWNKEELPFSVSTDTAELLQENITSHFWEKRLKNTMRLPTYFWSESQAQNNQSIIILTLQDHYECSQVRLVYERLTNRRTGWLVLYQPSFQRGWNRKPFPLQTERFHLSRLLWMLISRLGSADASALAFGSPLSETRLSDQNFGITETSSNPRPHIKDLPPELRTALHLPHAAWWSLTSESPAFTSITAGATFMHRCQSWASERKRWPLASAKWI